MAHFVRQTNYALTELVSLFNNGNTGNLCFGKNYPGRGVPTGLIINEVGVLLHTTETNVCEHVVAEEFLRSVLSDDLQYIGNRATAFFYLKYPSIELSDETESAVRAFEQDVQNREVVSHVLGTIHSSIAQ